MLLFFKTKRDKLLSVLIKAFPREYAADVEAVLNSLTVKSKADGGQLISSDTTEWRLESGETVSVPYRIFVSDKISSKYRFTPIQRMIYHCIFSRSYDGFVRQKHMEALLEADIPKWAVPYVIKICDEYVKEILEAVYESLRNKSCESFKALCRINFDQFKKGHSRMISYWNEYYRYDCYRFKDYIGKKLYSECFGYNKTGQKAIQ